MTATRFLNRAEEQNLRDACLTGLVPCDGTTQGHTGYGRDLSVHAASERWSTLLALATRDRIARVAVRPSSAMSLSGEAQTLGLVPHGRSHFCEACTPHQRRVLKAAGLIEHEYRLNTRRSDFHLSAFGLAFD